MGWRTEKGKVLTSVSTKWRSQCYQETHCWHGFLWTIPGLFFFYFSSFLHSWQLTISSKNFADDWIRTSDLWCLKRPLCQLSHNHYPFVDMVRYLLSEMGSSDSECSKTKKWRENLKLRHKKWTTRLSY